MSHFVLLLCCLSWLACPASHRYPELIRREASTPPVTVFHDVRVFTATGLSALEHQDVRVEGARIVAITDTAALPPGARIIEGAGKTLIPGYVDFHVHVTGSPAPPWAVAWPDDAHNGRALLASGITSAMDVGGDLHALEKLSKNQFQSSWVGPRFTYSGQIVSLKGGYPTSMVNILFPFPANLLADQRFSGPVTTPKQATDAVDARLEKGASHVKLAIASVPLDAPTMPAELVSAVTSRAHQQHVKAVAHTDSAEHALRAARGGVDALMHGIHLGELTPAQALELKALGVVVAPTLVVFDRAEQLVQFRFAPTVMEQWLYPKSFLEPFSREVARKQTLNPELMAWLDALQRDKPKRLAAVKTLYDAGVPLLAGSDAAGSIGCLAGGAFLDELRLLAEAGVPNADVLRAATVLPARFIAGPGADFGTIEAGKRADLVLLDGNPLDDIAVTSRLVKVMQAGVLIERVAGPCSPLPQPATFLRLLAWALLDVLLIVACWGLCALGPEWLCWLVAPVIGSRVHALAVLLHEVCHGPPSVGVAARLVEVLGGWTVGTTLEAMRAHHLRHHARTNGALDPYFIPRKRFGQVGLFVVLLGLVPFWVFRSILGSASLLVPALRTPYAWLLVFGEDDEASQGEVDRARTREPLVVMFWLGLAAATAFWPSWWLRQWWLPLCWLAFFNAVRFVAEHSTVEVEARNDPRATHDHTGQVVGFFVFPHHIGHHRAHHLFPSASWEALPAVSRALAQHGAGLATVDRAVPR